MPLSHGKGYGTELAIAAALAAAVFIIYMPSLGAGFVNWDDPGLVYENPSIRSLDLKWAFSAVLLGHWMPLTFLSYTLDYYLWGYDPFGYHLTSNILHSLNTGLVFLIALRLFSASGRLKAGGVFIAAAITAILFGLHPTRVESVVWITERKDVLCAFFYFLTVLAYLRYASKKSLAWYAISLALFALALLSKALAVTLPVALLIIDFFIGRLGSELKKTIAEKLPFFALSAAVSITAIFTQGSQGALMSAEMYPAWARPFVAVRSIGFYIYKTLLPFDLAPFYSIPKKEDLFDVVFIASAAFIVAASVISIVLIRMNRAIVAAWIYFIITLLPVLGFFQAGSQGAADRYTYLPMIGLYILVSAGAAMAIAETWNGRRLISIAVIAAALGISVLLSALTVRQSSFWKDSLTLWNRQIEIYPERTAQPYNQRGLVFVDEGRFSEAIADFSMAIKISPADSFAYNNRGLAFMKSGDIRQAITDFRIASSLSQSRPEPLLNLSLAYTLAGERELAIEAVQKARQLGYGGEIPWM